MSRPEKMLTITGVPPNYTKFSKLRRRMARALQRKGYDLGEWCVTIEINSKTPDRYHAHMLTHSGGRIPKRVLSEAAVRAGFDGNVEVNHLTYWHRIGYVMKEAVTDDLAEAYLERNGGNLTNHSREFFRNPDGEPLRAHQADALASPQPVYPVATPRDDPVSHESHRLGRGPAEAAEAAKPDGAHAEFVSAQDSVSSRRHRLGRADGASHRPQPPPRCPPSGAARFDALLAELDLLAEPAAAAQPP